MTRTRKTLLILVTTLLASTGTAQAGDPIVGNWKRPNGIIVAFSPCGGSFCASPVTGPNAGKSAGKLSPTGDGHYKGTLTDLESDKTYTGKGAINGNTLTIAGCMLAVLCKSESWVRK